MMRRQIALLMAVSMLCVGAASAAPESSLEIGLRAFRSGDDVTAAAELEAAAQSLSPLDLEGYVETGQLERLQSFETALVYLALVRFRGGREDDARESIQRLLAAERLVPVYARLPLETDAAGFETLVSALVPAATLERNTQFDVVDATLPLPQVRPVARQETPMTMTQGEERDARQLAVREYLAGENESAEAERRTASTVREVEGASARASLESLRQAESFAEAGHLEEAAQIYTRVAATAPREIVAAAAVGLYRTSAYRDAVEAFDRLGALARDEGDLRYYYAVSLYESGAYEKARRELACALPFIEMTDAVARYRTRIEQALIHESSGVL